MIQNKSKRASGKRLEGGTISPRLARCVYFCLLTFAFCLSAASAQDDPIDLVPPPLKMISKEERSRLDTKTDIKERTKLSIEMMTARLMAAEKFCRGDGVDFDAMFRELGVFHALIDDSIDFLNRRNTGSNKVLDNFKRLEIGLRGFSPRIEMIRRELPLRYDDYVRKLMKYVRDARTRAVDPLFGETVVPNRRPPN